MSLALLWFGRVFIFICMVICYTMLILEIFTRAVQSESTMNTDKKNNNEYKYQHWLKRWSLFGFIVALIRITCLCGYSISDICIILNIRYGPPQLAINCIITCYQIARLHHAFDTKNDRKFRYILNFLYINGIGICLFVTGFNIVTTEIVQSETFRYCVIVRDPEFVPFWLPTVIFWYYIWDLTVLFLYVYKLNKLKKDSKQSSSKRKISMFLRKILILTGWIEISTLIFGLLAIGFESNYSISNMCLSMDVVMSEIVIYLMSSHNHKQYSKLMRWFTERKLCCCRDFVYQSITTQDDDDSVNNNNNMEIINSDNTDNGIQDGASPDPTTNNFEMETTRNTDLGQSQVIELQSRTQ